MRRENPNHVKIDGKTFEPSSSTDDSYLVERVQNLSAERKTDCPLLMEDQNVSGG